MKRNIYISFLFFFSLMLVSQSGFAQPDSVNKAVSILQNQSLSAEVRTKRALEIIDKSIQHPECINNGYVWYVRGYIYKESYKLFEIHNRKSKTRSDAVEYLKHSLELFSKDTSSLAKETLPDLKNSFKYLGSKFQSDAVDLLATGDTNDIHTAILNFGKFKECYLLANPAFNIKGFEIDFKTVLADKYAESFRGNTKTNSRFFGLAETTYKQVLALDSNNWAGNYNLALLYYNYGVDLINGMSTHMEEIPLIDVTEIQDQSKDLFKNALPFALKAYALNPKRKEVLVALQGIYFALYEFEQSDMYKAKIEEMDKEK